MKLQDPDLNRQLEEAVHRYDQLPGWMREASNSQRELEIEKAGEETEQSSNLILCD